MRTRAALLAPLAVLALLAAAPSAQAARDRCTARSAKIVKQNAQVRVFTVARAHGAADWYACLRGTGRPRKVAHTFSDSKFLDSASVRSVLVAGTSAALIRNNFEDIGPEGAESETVAVLDLRRRGRSYEQTVDTEEGPYSAFSKLVLRADGGAAWVLSGNSTYSEVDVLGAKSDRAVPVSFAKGIDERSLKLTSDGISWIQDGATLTAAIVDAPADSGPPGAGKLIATYGRCGTQAPPKPASTATPAGSLKLPDGGLLAFGVRMDTVVTVKLRPDGSIDTSFGNGGQASAKLTGFTRPFYEFRAVLAQADGKILLAGRGGETNSGRNQAVVARLNPDGSLDTTFGSGGTVIDALPGGMRSESSGIDVDATGRILVAGERDQQFVVARLSPSGMPDASWGPGGIAQLTFPGTKEGAAAAVRVLPGGEVLVGGGADEQFALARLNDAGAPVPGFAVGGLSLQSPPASAAISVLEPLADGRILAAGRGDDVNGEEQALARFLPDGRIDPTFGRGGFALGTDVARPNQILVQPDGSLLVPGRGFARYSADGVLDPGFGVGGEFDSFQAGDLVQEPDGSAIGLAGRGNSAFAFERYALAGPALDALGGQHAVCLPRITTSRVKQLVRADDTTPRYGGIAVSFASLQPGSTTWRATATAGGKTYRFRALRYPLGGAFEDELVIPSTKRIQARLARAKRVALSVTVVDQAGHELTAERTLRP